MAIVNNLLLTNFLLPDNEPFLYWFFLKFSLPFCIFLLAIKGCLFTDSLLAFTDMFY
jgi:hypothetical protein